MTALSAPRRSPVVFDSHQEYHHAQLAPRPHDRFAYDELVAPIIVIGALGFGIDLTARRLFTARRHSVGRRSAGRNILPETALGPTSDRVQSKRPPCRLSSPANFARRAATASRYEPECIPVAFAGFGRAVAGRIVAAWAITLPAAGGVAPAAHSWLGPCSGP